MTLQPAEGHVFEKQLFLYLCVVVLQHRQHTPPAKASLNSLSIQYWFRFIPKEVLACTLLFTSCPVVGVKSWWSLMVSRQQLLKTVRFGSD